MPSNTTLTFNIFLDLLGIENDSNFSLARRLGGGYFAALGGSRG
jgi:hypothetical protein